MMTREANKEVGGVEACPECRERAGIVIPFVYNDDQFRVRYYYRCSGCGHTASDRYSRGGPVLSTDPVLSISSWNMYCRSKRDPQHTEQHVHEDQEHDKPD